MRFPFRRIGLALASGALVFWCSCDKHRVGEAPEVQKEHVDLAYGAGEAPSATPAASAAVTPTPADFFPEKKP